MRFNSKYWTNQETELFVSEWNKHYQWAQKEREYYNQNIELAKEKSKLIEENYLLNQGKVEYRSLNATAHYS